MANSNVRLSVLLTIYNRQDLLVRQLDYISKSLSGFDLGYEIIIYDDFSTEPLFIPKDFSSDFLVKIFRGETNVGLIEARNRLVGLANSSSEFLLFVDDDIFIYNFSLAIKSAIKCLESGYNIFSVPYLNLPTEYRGGLAWFKYLIDFRQGEGDAVFFNGGASFFSRKTFTDFGFLEGRYYFYLEEEDFALRLTSGGGKIRYAYGESFVAIHDQPSGKSASKRHVYRLSNRFLFHWKFFNRALALFSNVLYTIVYLVKLRQLGVIRDSWSRYLGMRNDFTRHPIGFRKLCSFMAKRYLNIWL